MAMLPPFLRFRRPAGMTAGPVTAGPTIATPIAGTPPEQYAAFTGSGGITFGGQMAAPSSSVAGGSAGGARVRRVGGFTGR